MCFKRTKNQSFRQSVKQQKLKAKKLLLLLGGGGGVSSRFLGLKHQYGWLRINLIYVQNKNFHLFNQSATPSILSFVPLLVSKPCLSKLFWQSVQPRQVGLSRFLSVQIPNPDSRTVGIGTHPPKLVPFSDPNSFACVHWLVENVHPCTNLFNM